MLDIPVAEEPDALISLRSDCNLNDCSLQAGIEQRIKWAQDQISDLVALRVHPETAQYFEAEEGNLWSLLNTLQFLVSDVRVHDRPSPAQGSVRSPALRVVAGGV